MSTKKKCFASEDIPIVIHHPPLHFITSSEDAQELLSCKDWNFRFGHRVTVKTSNDWNTKKVCLTVNWNTTMADSGVKKKPFTQYRNAGLATQSHIHKRPFFSRAPIDNLRWNMCLGESNCSKNFGSTLLDLLKHHLKDSNQGQVVPYLFGRDT